MSTFIHPGVNFELFTFHKVDHLKHIFKPNHRVWGGELTQKQSFKPSLAVFGVGLVIGWVGFGYGLNLYVGVD